MSMRTGRSFGLAWLRDSWPQRGVWAALSRMGPGGTHPTRLPSYESCDPAPAQFAPLFLSGFAPGARERLRPPWLNA